MSAIVPNRAVTPNLRADPSFWVIAKLMEQVVARGEDEALGDIAEMAGGNLWGDAFALARAVECLRALKGIDLYGSRDTMTLGEQLQEATALLAAVRKKIELAKASKREEAQ